MKTTSPEIRPEEDGNVALRWFSGTGNSLRIAEICAETLAGAGCTVDLQQIIPGMREEIDGALGIFCPTYAYGLPRIVKRYLRTLTPGRRHSPAFVVVTSGGADEEGWALVHARRLLKRQGFVVRQSTAIHMPNNWRPGTPVPSAGEARPLLAAGEVRARAFTGDVLAGRPVCKSFVYPPFGLVSHAAFHTLGISRMWRFFCVSEDCTGCGLCARVCPTGSIEMVDGTPRWSASCEQCLRCMHCCPQNAILQLERLGHGSRRPRYLEPHFHPDGWR